MNTKQSCVCVITAHLPMLRIEPERIEFSGFDLWRMPFEVYKSLAGDNLASLEAEYQAVSAHSGTSVSHGMGR